MQNSGSKLSQEQQNTLLIQLMELTGLALSVNKTGKLVIVQGLRGIGAGSATARNYLSQLISFTADQHQSGLHLVVNAVNTVEESEYSTERGKQHIVNVAFETVNANNVDPLAYSPGTFFFHESHHFSTYFKYGTPLFGMGAMEDPRKGSVELLRGDKGPTVEFENQIRRELSLPERETYGGFTINGIIYQPFDQTSKAAVLRGIVPASNTKYF